MIDKSIVVEKFQTIDRCLARIEEKILGNVDNLDVVDNQDIFILNLQRAAQASIDVAAHIIKDHNLELPSTLREYFITLASNKFISEGTAKNFAKMVGFRNIAVHNYEKIDVKILASIYKNNLKDFQQFQKEILAVM
ncbi:MAG: DUF86 domain-containing protein [Bdellovibrionota bacterium]